VDVSGISVVGLGVSLGGAVSETVADSVVIGSDSVMLGVGVSMGF